MYYPKPANELSKRTQWTLRFPRGLSVLRKNRTFGEIFCPPTHFEGSKMCCCCLGQDFVGVPVFALGVCVSTFDFGGFLLWVLNNHLNKTPSRIAIRLCARCTLEEGC